MPKFKKITEGPIHKALFFLAIPIIFGQLLQSAYQIIDAFWVGRLGAKEVAAVSVSFPITFLVISLGIGFGIAGSTLTSQYMGARQYKNVNIVAGQTLLLVFFTSIILGTLGYLITPQIIDLMGIDKDVKENAKSFLKISFISIIFVFSFNTFQSLFRGIGEVRIPLYIVSTTVVLNAILDPVLIFGFGPIPSYGVSGAAIATLITQGIAAITGFIILSNGKYGIHIYWRKLRPDWTYIKKSFLLGAPASLDMSTRALGLVLMTFLVSGFGTSTMAAYGVGSNLIQIILVPAIGIAMSVSTVVGQNLGANNPKRAHKAALIGASSGFLILTLIGFLSYIFSFNIASFFISGDVKAVSLSVDFIKSMSLTWGFIAIQLCITSVFRASGNMVYAMMLSMINQWVMQFPIAYFLSYHTSLGQQGIWYSFALTNISISLVSLLWFFSGSWKNKSLIKY